MNISLSTAIVILNWNGQHFLEKYLPGVKACSQLPDVSVIVADNASTDSSLAYLRVNHPDVRIVELDRNYGFAEGYNRALQQVEADYYLLLNSDVEVTAGWLPPMLDLIQRPNVAACMPKIKSAANRASFEYAGAAGGFMDKYGYTFCRGRLFNTVETDTGQYDVQSEIFWATGACFMIKASLFHRMNGFDSLFFAHMEEIDLCWRLKNQGYSIWYTPESTVYHVGGGMLPQNSPFKAYLNYRNNLLMLYKNLPSGYCTRILLIRIILDLISAVYFLLQGDLSILKAVWKAHLAFWKIRSNYRTTDRISQSFPHLFGIYNRSIAYQYFIKKVRKYNDVPGWE